MSDWGKGVENNTIEWGRGSTNNSNGWGSAYGESWAGLTALEVGFLLDQYAGAAAAYSVRQLSSSYSGSALRVRRSSDNTEQDIGFDSNGDLDTSALTTFVGANDGFVVTWYDQSGNGNNATQSMAASQPQIVSSGTLITKSSKPTLDSTALGFPLENATNPTTGTTSTFTVFSADSNTQDSVMWQLLQDSDDYISLGLGSIGTSATYGSRFSYNGGTLIGSGGVLNNTNIHVSSLLTTTTPSITAYLDGNVNTTTDQSRSNTTGSGYSLFSRGNSGFGFDGKISEWIIYETDQSTNRTAIEQNINAYYSIY